MSPTRIGRTRVELTTIALHTLRQLAGLEHTSSLEVQRVVMLPGQGNWDVAAILPTIEDSSIAIRAHQAIEQLRLQFDLKG